MGLGPAGWRLPGGSCWDAWGTRTLHCLSATLVTSGAGPHPQAAGPRKGSSGWALHLPRAFTWEFPGLSSPGGCTAAPHADPLLPGGRAPAPAWQAPLLSPGWSAQRAGAWGSWEGGWLSGCPCHSRPLLLQSLLCLPAGRTTASASLHAPGAWLCAATASLTGVAGTRTGI